jgi:hypothetical protein
LSLLPFAVGLHITHNFDSPIRPGTRGGTGRDRNIQSPALQTFRFPNLGINAHATDPVRVAAISRWLSEATPPVRNPPIVFASRRDASHARLDQEDRSFANLQVTWLKTAPWLALLPECTGFETRPRTGGVASLNHRLIARNPPGSIEVRLYRNGTPGQDAYEAQCFSTGNADPTRRCESRQGRHWMAGRLFRPYGILTLDHSLEWYSYKPFIILIL